MPRKKTTASKSTTSKRTASKRRTSKKTAAAATKGSDKILQTRAAMTQILKGDDSWVANSLDPALLTESMPHLPTGSHVVDYRIGGTPDPVTGVRPCPGLPKGRLTQIWGEESSGKTTFCLTLAARTIRDGGEVLYVDWEHALEPKYSSRIMGHNIGASDWFLWAQPDTLEEGIQLMLLFAASGGALVIIDSVGAAITKNQDEMKPSEVGTGSKGGDGIGAAARRWNDFLPKLKKLCNKTGTTVCAISQTRDKIGAMGYGPKKNIQGGNAWKFYAAVRFGLKVVKTHKRNSYNALTNKYEEQVYARTVRITMAKCKIASTAGAMADFYIRQGEGIDNVWTLIDVAKAHGIVKGSAWLTWVRPNGEAFKQQGLERFRHALLSEPELLAEFESMVVPLLSGVSTDDEEPEVEVDSEQLMADMLKKTLEGDDEDGDDDFDESDEGDDDSDVDGE